MRAEGVCTGAIDSRRVSFEILSTEPITRNNSSAPFPGSDVSDLAAEMAAWTCRGTWLGLEKRRRCWRSNSPSLGFKRRTILRNIQYLLSILWS
jgi:hypothetical protein